MSISVPARGGAALGGGTPAHPFVLRIREAPDDTCLQVTPTAPASPLATKCGLCQSSWPGLGHPRPWGAWPRPCTLELSPHGPAPGTVWSPDGTAVQTVTLASSRHLSRLGTATLSPEAPSGIGVIFSIHNNKE
ncbi:hypothetical protein P7K49_030743 [Saguinus oedipus]|uniref:Uncharacterized protein n=1 Tax=Saguinus oedipus TaxID=9490 RepID=A0ABQ9U313_SAGOE|nr:hypothetical protein P7K49_030743 [Saguinus oedipus]